MQARVQAHCRTCRLGARGRVIQTSLIARACACVLLVHMLVTHTTFLVGRVCVYYIFKNSARYELLKQTVRWSFGAECAFKILFSHILGACYNIYSYFYNTP